MKIESSGHGHVYERSDGFKARCGGPALCSECAKDLATMTDQPSPTPVPGAGERMTAEIEQLLNDIEAALDGSFHEGAASKAFNAAHAINNAAWHAGRVMDNIRPRILALADTLSARAEAAEAECARLTSELAGITDRIMERITNAHDQGYREATNAAEARAETARREALEGAALLVEGGSLATNYMPQDKGFGALVQWIADRDFKTAKSIRALLTAPPPTAGREG